MPPQLRQRFGSDMTMENISLAAQSHAIRFLKGMRPLFYVEPPSQSCFQNVEDVPDYLEKVGWIFFRRGLRRT